MNLISANAVSEDISISSPDSVNIGRSFNVNFVLDNTSLNISAIKLSVNYDNDHLSLKSAECTSQGEVEFYDENGTAVLICLYADGIGSSDKDFLTLTFTAKTGQDSGSQTIEFNCSQAVSTDLTNLSISMTSSVNIDIVKSGDSSTTNGNAASQTSQTGSNNSNASNSSSNTNSQRSSSSKTYIYGSNGEIIGYIEDNGSIEADNNSTAAFGYLFNNNSNLTGILTGSGITLSLVVITALAFHIGKVSGRRTSGLSDSDSKTEQPQNSDEKNDNHYSKPNK